MLCSKEITINVQHYMASPMLVQCVIASHVEVLAYQFGGNSIRS